VNAAPVPKTGKGDMVERHMLIQAMRGCSSYRSRGLAKVLKY
jgi:hypothetical protein